MQKSNISFDFTDLFNLNASIAGKIIATYAYPWQVLHDMDELITSIGSKLPDDYVQVRDNLFIHKSSKVENQDQIEGAGIVGPNTHIKSNSVLRAGVIIGADCYIGNFVEVKNSILFDGVQLPHYNYVGDSILGAQAHLGAGAKISNFRSLPGNVKVTLGERTMDSGLLKFGALLGDHSEIGCNAVLNPGSIIGKQAIIYPLVSWRGQLPANTIAKDMDNIVARH